MDHDQAAITQFLQQWPDTFVSRREICRRAAGKWRFREDENWATPVLQRMVEEKMVESDQTGHYRLVREKSRGDRDKQRMWLSPALRALLKQSGHSFETVDLEQEPAGDAVTSQFGSA